MNLLFLFIFLAASSELKEAQPTALYDVNGNLCPEDPTGSCVHWPPVNNANGQNNKWKGVGQLFRNGEGGCTVNLIKIPNCPKPKKPQVITNGHCIDGKSSKLSVKFGGFADSSSKDHMSFEAKNIYSSYYVQDFGIMELDTDYDSLTKVIKPYEVATTPLDQKTQFETVGFPVNGLPKNQVTMRHGVCTPTGDKKTVTNERFVWENELTFTGCSLRGGSSGSALFDGGKIYGLLHAGALNEEHLQGSDACLKDTCVLDGNKNPKHEKVNYGYDITNLHKCYKDCKIDTSLPGCMLPDPKSKIGFTYVKDNHSSNLKKRFDIHSNFNKYQVKGCKAGDTTCSCSDPSGYKEHVGKSISAEPFFEDGATYSVQPNQPLEMRFLCVRGRNDDGTLDAAKNTVQLPIYLKSIKFGLPFKK